MVEAIATVAGATVMKPWQVARHSSPIGTKQERAH
jgi:hypothetical protein